MMKDEDKTREQLINELAELRQRVTELEASETERKRVEKVLRETTQLLETILNRTHMLVAYLDPQFNFVRVNRAYAEADEREPSFFPGKNHFDLYPNAENEEIFERVVEAGEPYFAYAKPFEYAEHPERGVTYWDWSLVPIKDPGGAVTGLIFTLANVTERVRVEEALRESEQKFRTLAKSTTASIAIVETDKLFYVNPSMERLTGYSSEELLSMDFLNLVHPDFRDLVKERALARQRGEDIPSQYEIKLLTKDGKERWIDYAGGHIEFEGAPAVIGTAYDITERKRAEEQIKASLREKEVLLKEIHHRVKNNLQVMSSLLRLQSEYIEDERSLKIFKESQDRVKAMALVHERLYQSEDLARIDFAEYLRNLAVRLFRSYRVSSSAITLKVDVDDVFLGIDTAIPCGLIINELVSNALKHAFPAGREGEICINLRADDDELTLIVSNNGVNFPENLDFHNTESLGLRLVTTLVSQLEGTIELDRSGGTAFKITFAKPTR